MTRSCKVGFALMLIGFLWAANGCGGSKPSEPIPIKGMNPGDYRDSFDAKPTPGKSTKTAKKGR